MDVSPAQHSQLCARGVAYIKPLNENQLVNVNQV